MSDDELDLVDLTIPSSPPSTPLPRSTPPSTITAATPLGTFSTGPPSSASLHPLFRPDDIRRRFSPAEILLFEDRKISQWFKSFIAIRRLYLLDAVVLLLVT